MKLFFDVYDLYPDIRQFYNWLITRYSSKPQSSALLPVHVAYMFSSSCFLNGFPLKTTLTAFKVKPVFYSIKLLKLSPPAETGVKSVQLLPLLEIREHVPALWVDGAVPQRGQHGTPGTTQPAIHATEWAKDCPQAKFCFCDLFLSLKKITFKTQSWWNYSL